MACMSQLHLLLWKWHRHFPDGQVIDTLSEVSMQSKKFIYGFMEIPIKLWFIYNQVSQIKFKKWNSEKESCC